MRRVALLLIAMSACSFAAGVQAGDWEVQGGESEVTAVGVLNGKERKISFAEFDADISFDASNLAASTIAVTFDITKIEDPLDFTGDVVATMMHPTWFDGENISKASFVSSEITATENGDYEAVGMLTIKSIEKEVTIPFAFETLEAEKAVAVTDGVTLNRHDFGLGSDWTFPGYEVDDDVVVAFRIVALASLPQ